MDSTWSLAKQYGQAVFGGFEPGLNYRDLGSSSFQVVERLLYGQFVNDAGLKA